MQRISKQNAHLMAFLLIHSLRLAFTLTSIIHLLMKMANLI
nr:MAG TPA: hypothetical protein [Caudoviricetes sp.]